MSVPESPYSKYADQNQVFNVLGKQVLDNAWEGYHCCLFAYGQTGSGKSYSMVGYGADRGIVPMACEEIFNRIRANTDTNKRFEVYCSMLEIYNENVYDLLNLNKKDQKGLEIRESKLDGVFVQNLSKTPVSSYEAIDNVVQKGTSNRTVGETLMNKSSSRAHTVVMIRFEQVTTFENGKEGRKISVINLVDLAGSEKANQTGASGDRLKEGCNINKSLSALGNVIKALADVSEGKSKAGSVVVPYRDSKLTRLLQNALGGSSKTIMICALSPANTNFEETLSTLRYADRAKAIKNKAMVNEDPQEKRMRELMEENERLKSLLAKGGAVSPDGVLEDSDSLMAEKKRLEEQMAEMQKSWEQKLEEAKKEAAAKAATDPSASHNAGGVSLAQWMEIPHIYNLNEDITLAGRLRFKLENAKSLRVGRRPRADHSDAKAPDVQLSGMAIKPQHCELGLDADCKSGWIQCNDDSAVVFVDGVKISSGKKIPFMHKSVIVLGETMTAVFKVFLPLCVDHSKDEGDGHHTLMSGVDDFFAAMDQITHQQQGGRVKSIAEEEEDKKKREEFEEKLRKVAEEKKQAEEAAAAAIHAKELEYEAKMREMENRINQDEKKKLEDELELAKVRAAEESARAQAEADKERRGLERKEAERVARDQMLSRLDEELREVMPKAKEASLIAGELGLPYSLNAVLTTSGDGTTTAGSSAFANVKVGVHYGGKKVYEWSPEVLDSRLYLMRDLYERCANDEFDINSLDEENDPWWDPVQSDRLIGTAMMSLLPLGTLFEVEQKARILSPDGSVKGLLDVRIDPVNKNGDLLEEEDVEDIETPENLVGKDVHFQINLRSLKELPSEFKNVYVLYRWYLESEPTKAECKEGAFSPSAGLVLNHSRRVSLTPCTRRFSEWVQDRNEGVLRVQVYGKDAEAQAVEERRTVAVTARKNVMGGKGGFIDDGETVYSGAPTMVRHQAFELDKDSRRDNIVKAEPDSSSSSDSSHSDNSEKEKDGKKDIKVEKSEKKTANNEEKEEPQAQLSSKLVVTPGKDACCVIM